jgi:hypothetical protein
MGVRANVRRIMRWRRCEDRSSEAPTRRVARQISVRGLHRVAVACCFSLFALLFSWGGVAASTSSDCNTTPPPKQWGTWTINAPATFGTGACPDWYKGHVVTAFWNKIEPVPTPPGGPGSFDFTVFDKKLNTVLNKGLYAIVQVLGGENVPSWFDPGAPVHVDGIGTDLDGRTYPLYFQTNPDGSQSLNQKYLDYFHRMVGAFVGHINTYTRNRDHIIGFGCPVGNSTDPYPYDPHGTHFKDLQHGGFGAYGTASFIPFDLWQYFQIGDGDPSGDYQGELSFYVDAVAGDAPATPCLINANFTRETADYALDNLPDASLKLSRIGDRYDNNGEVNDDAYYVSTKTRELYHGHAVRTRSEMDLTSCKPRDRNCKDAWFTEAPAWNMYWSQLWALDRGLDMHNQTAVDVEDPRYAPAFAFYGEYAGYKSPQSSPGAWVAFRDNLDASDRVRFPETYPDGSKCDPPDPSHNCFGSYLTSRGTQNPQRYQAIESQFFRYGVQKPTDSRDSRYADYQRPDLGSTDWYGLEDVGNKTYSGNYGEWLTMLGPNATSQGLWRVGCAGVDPKNCTEPYGRFARRFDHARGLNSFYLDLDPRFFQTSGPHAVTINVIYYDDGNGSFSLRYDNGTGVDGATTSTVHLHNTDTWQTASFDLNDGVFENGLANQSDIIVQNEDTTQDVIFHMVELTRGTT